MKKHLFSSALLAAFILASASAAFAQYKLETAGAVPPGLASGFASLFQPQGSKILNADGSVFCEVWFRTTPPTGGKTTEDAVDFPSFPQGALIGVIHFPSTGADRRGQTIKPGLYTLRYSMYPVNGDHQGVSPNRDFVLLVPASEDKDPNATPNFDALVAMSRKASGTPHPAVLSIFKSSAESFPSLTQAGEKDWVLNVKVGDVPMSLIVVGKAEA